MSSIITWLRFWTTGEEKESWQQFACSVLCFPATDVIDQLLQSWTTWTSWPEWLCPWPEGHCKPLSLSSFCPCFYLSNTEETKSPCSSASHLLVLQEHFLLWRDFRAAPVILQVVSRLALPRQSGHSRHGKLGGSFCVAMLCFLSSFQTNIWTLRTQGPSIGRASLFSSLSSNIVFFFSILGASWTVINRRMNEWMQKKIKKNSLKINI